MRQRALEEAERWIRDRIGEGSDGLATVFPAMLNSLIALRALGYSKTDPVYAKAEKDFAGLFVDDPKDFRIQPCLSPVWDTAINIISLAESGIAADHPGLQRAADWLVKKEVRIRGDWAVNNPHPEASGWAFEYNNVYYPDTDDTVMVLMALRLIEPKDRHSLDQLFRRALHWELSFQCRDGGWAAFDKDVTMSWLEDMPFADHNAILDPTCSDLTARTLELLGYIGFDRRKDCVRRAIQYLIDTQEDDGSWYGRWGVNYIYGTWQVLRGLRAIGEDMTQDWILRGRDWLESCQNSDGGWGETCATYENPATKGIGDSTASQTAWALMGICACGDLDRSSVQRGLRYLLSSQNADGSWTEPEITGTGFPGVFYLKYRHVPPELPAAGTGYLRQLSPGCRPSPQRLPLGVICRAFVPARRKRVKAGQTAGLDISVKHRVFCPVQCPIPPQKWLERAAVARNPGLFQRGNQHTLYAINGIT